MFVPLMLSLLLPPPTPSAVPSPSLANPSAADPPIKVWLSNDVLMRGDRARMHVKATQDGYLVVLRADAAAHIRVLFDSEGGVTGVPTHPRSRRYAGWYNPWYDPFYSPGFGLRVGFIFGRPYRYRLFR